MDLDRQPETMEHLRDAMEQARALYEDARQEVERAKLQQDPGAGRPDGCLEQASRVHNDRWRNYRQAQSEFNRFILDGILDAIQDKRKPLA